MFGCAADIDPPDGVTVRDMVLWLRDESGLDYDQIIDESAGPNSSWLHLGMKKPDMNKARKEALLYRSGKYSLFV
jgi:hypothetical protein